MASAATIASPSLGRSSSLSNANAVSYEAFAPRSTSQVSRLSRIAALTAGPIAKATANNNAKATSSCLSQQSLSVPCMMLPSTSNVDDTNREAAELTHALLLQQKQHDKKPQDEENETDDKDTNDSEATDTTNLVSTAVTRATHLSQSLTQQWKHTTSVRLAVRASVNIAEDISQAHAALIRHSGELSAQADTLQMEAQQLEHHAEELGTPLQHYNAVDRIGVQVGVLFKNTHTERRGSHSQQPTTVRGLAKIKVDADDFETTLEQIDQAILYFGKEAGGQEALEELQQAQNKAQALQQPLSGNVEYYRRALVLQEAALFLIQEAVADRVTLTTQQIQNALQSQQGVVPADQLEASLIYTRFHGISSRSQRLLALVKKRLQILSQDYTGSEFASAAYYELLRTCRSTYAQCRERLLAPTIRAHLDALRNLHGPTGTTRLASVFLIRLCSVETVLYRDFFVGCNTNNKATDDRALTKHVDLQTCLANLCSALHATVRRSLVSCTDLDTLTGIVSVLREEGAQAQANPKALQAAKALNALTEDAQERVIFCANRTLQRDVIRFKATPLDLDYPNKLMQLKEKQHSAMAKPTDESATKDDDDDKVQDNSASSAQEQLNWVYESWFPPLRTVLRILSKIFRVVETRVFEDMALSSVQACTTALKDGAVFLQKSASQRDADLFLVKHLLILREQLSPFDMELRTVERQLDFSNTNKAVAKFLANRNRRLLSMSSSENAVLTLLREGVSVQESSVDSKRDLEEALRTACNDFIEHSVAAVAGRLVQFIQERNGDKGSSGTTKLSNKDGPDKVQGMLKETLEQTTSVLPALLETMGLYLDNPATQSILLKPVTKKILKATEELKKCISNTVDHNWNSEARMQALELAQQIEPAVKKWTTSSASTSVMKTTTSSSASATTTTPASNKT